jgi:hypothetical protein
MFECERAMTQKRTPSIKTGDHVEWQTPQGKTQGTVTRKVMGKAKAGGHTASASPADPEFEVQSDKSGKTAIHRPGALKKIARKKTG